MKDVVVKVRVGGKVRDFVEGHRSYKITKNTVILYTGPGEDFLIIFQSEKKKKTEK